MPDIVVAIFLTLASVIGSTIFHLEALSVIDRVSRWKGHRYLLVPGVLILVLAAHMLEIGGYAGVYFLADKVFDIGTFAGGDPSFGHLYYFAAETYSSLGLDDVLPRGALRLIVAIGSLNGILLLTWSGTFLYTFASGLRDPKAH